MNKIKALFLIAAILLFSGCGTKVPFKAQEALDGAALLYVYVEDKISDDESMQDSLYKIQINGKNVAGEIKSGEYKVFDMKPDTLLVTSIRRNIEKMHIKVSMEEGNSYFLKIESGSFGSSYSFEEVGTTEGQRGVSKTVLAGATGVDLTAYAPDFGGSTAGEDGKTSVPAMTEAQIDAIIEKKLSAMKAAAPVVNTPVVTTTTRSITTPKVSKMDEVQRAFDMMQNGMLTREEFNTIKAEILAK